MAFYNSFLFRVIQTRNFLFILLAFNFVHSRESINVEKECSSTTGHLTRGDFTCCYASPRHVPIQPAIDFRNGWKKCAVPPKNLNEDPVVSAWRVYSCIIFSKLRGKPLLPSTFARMVTARYPRQIKNAIVSQMSDFEDDDVNFDIDVDCFKRIPYPKVNLVRNLYYDTEQEICEDGYEAKAGALANRKPKAIKLVDVMRNVSSYSTKDVGDLLCEKCSRRREIYHRNGDCCGDVPIPFTFIYLPFRYGSQNRVRQCTEDIVDDVGLPSDTSFATHLKYLCYSSCEHFLSGTISESDLWAGVDLVESNSRLRELASKMMPVYFSSKYRDDIIQYIVENFRDAWRETKTFESNVEFSQRDERNCNKGKLKNLLASCKTHRLIETIATFYLNDVCDEEYQYQSDDKTSKTTPKSTIYDSAFSSNEDYASESEKGHSINWILRSLERDLMDNITNIIHPKRKSSRG